MDPSRLELICFNDNMQSDGFHPLKDHMTEWWYYCIRSSKGIFSGLFEINGKLKNGFFNKPKALQSHYIYLPDKDPVEFHNYYSINDVFTSEDGFHVGIGKSFFKKENDKYLLEIHNDLFDLSLVAENIVAGNPNTVSMYLPNKKDYGVHWRNPILRAECKGNFSFKNEDRIELDGSFFHDHNWHNLGGKKSLEFIKNMKSWDWCILHDDKKELSLLVVDSDYESNHFQFTALKKFNSDLEVVKYDKNFSFKKNKDHYYIRFSDKELVISIKKEHFITPYPALGFLARKLLANNSVQSHCIGPYTLFQNQKLISKGTAYTESFDLNGKKLS